MKDMKSTYSKLFLFVILLLLLGCHNPSGELTEQEVWELLEGSWLQLSECNSLEEAQKQETKRDYLLDSLRNLCFVNPNDMRDVNIYFNHGISKIQLTNRWNIRRAPQLHGSLTKKISLSYENGHWILNKDDYGQDGFGKNRCDTIMSLKQNTAILWSGGQYKYVLLEKINDLFEYNINVHESAEAIASKQWVIDKKEDMISGDADSVSTINYDNIKPVLVSTNSITAYNLILGHKIYIADYTVELGRYSEQCGIETSSPYDYDRLFCSFGYYDFWCRDFYVSVFSLKYAENSEIFAPDAVFKLENMTVSSMEAVREVFDQNGNKILKRYYLRAL